MFSRMFLRRVMHRHNRYLGRNHINSIDLIKNAKGLAAHLGGDNKIDGDAG